MSNKHNATIRNVTISHAIKVTKEIDNWKLCEHGEVTGLSRAIGTTRKFASKVITAVRNGQENHLYARNRRRDSIQGSGVLARFEEFLRDQQNSRAVLGQFVSVAYKVRKPKYLLLKSKATLIVELLEQNEDINCHCKVLLRDWPRNFKTLSSRY